MGRQVTQVGDWLCGEGGTPTGKNKFFINLPLTLDCPISRRLYERYDLNDVNASIGDMDPIDFANLLTDGEVINGIKTYQKNPDGVEVSQTLIVKPGGDGRFLRRIENLVNDIGGQGGDILLNAIMEIESTIEGISPTIKRTRYYQIMIGDGKSPNTGTKAPEDGYEFPMKIPSRPMVIDENEGAVLDTQVSLTVSDTLTYDKTTNLISGTVTIDEFVDKTIEANVSVLDTEQREGYLNLGSHSNVETTNGEIVVKLDAPVNVDTKSVSVSVMVAGIIVLAKEIAIPDTLTVDVITSDIAQTAAKFTATVTDTGNKLKSQKLDYEIVDIAKNKVVSKGKVTSGNEVALTGLTANTRYKLEITSGGLPIKEVMFTTTK